MRLKKVKHIVIHSSRTPPKKKSYGYRELYRKHVLEGGSGVGYHIIIRRNGEIDRGVPLDTMGIHTYGHNEHSIGVCLVGGIDEHGATEDNFTRKQKVSLQRMLAVLVEKFPRAKPIEHFKLRNRDARGSPGFSLVDWGLEETEDEK